MSTQAFFNFSCMFLNPNIFSNLNYISSNSFDERNVQEQVKKSILLPNIVLTFHCLNKLLKWSQTLCKFLVLSLEFQSFSINVTIFTHNRSEQVWLQNTKNVKNMRYEQNYLDRRVVGSFITITSAMSPNLEKYSFRPSAKKIRKNRH